ncbi:MAG TPA: amidohydrolase family protein, partial [Candidatus Nanopelagicales bacterium]|nr:amidohydrolase family protein [Candidatus Nanopelagicales bacterium]
MSAPVADLLLTDATVLTMAPDGLAPRAGAVALLGDRVLHVGQDDAGLTAKRTVSLGGRCVVPGFHDAHQHMAWFGASLDEIDLSTPPIRNLDDVAAAVAAANDTTPADRWIVGNGYDENKIGGHPDRDLLERAAPGRRVLLTHTSGHMAVVSTAVLEELGISEHGRDVPGGTIALDGSGRPTGLLQEQAQNLLTPLRRPVAVDEVAHAIARASEVYIRQGITSVVEAGVGGGWIGRTPVEALAYQRARDAGRLAVRVELMVVSPV